MTRRHLKVNENLYLVQEEVQEAPQAIDGAELGCTNHIFIYDRSGSMYGLLRRLTEDFIKRCATIPVGDTISIGWFSSEGQFNFILKGFKISGPSDYTIIENAVRQNDTTLGCTCFSEILHETADTVIKDLSVFSDRFALTFFTDGYPVVSSYSREVTEIYSAISKLEKVLTSALLVGYGNYYNKELMADMAQKLGGSLVHSNDIESFSVAMTDFIANVKGVDNKIKVKLSADYTGTYFSVSEGSVLLYEPTDGVINFSPAKRGKNYLYVLTENAPKDSEDIKLVDSAVNHNSKIPAFLKGIYGAAYLLVQRARVATALELLGALGDTSLIDSVANAFTNEEYGKAESRIAECITNTNKRFLHGRNVNYLPAKDAFCVLDLIELLCNDDNAYFYPRHKDFKYNRIGATSVPKEGYPTFEADSNAKCKFNSVSWNDTRMNLSVLLNLPGQIMLKKGYKKVGFKSKMYDTFVWRNYTLIKDGFLNVTKIPVSVSDLTYVNLLSEGLVVSEADGIVVLDLTKLPIMNRMTSEKCTSATELFNLSWESLNQKAALKVYKYLKSEMPDTDTDSTKGVDGLTAEQVEYLKSLGVTDRGFSPPVEKVSSTDYYFSKEFKISIKGYSTIPAVKDVVDKLKGGKKLTPSESLLVSALNAAKGKDAEWLDAQIKTVTAQNRAVVEKIQRTKFGIILGNQWFDEFTSREDCTLALNGVTFSVSLTNKKIDI